MIRLANFLKKDLSPRCLDLIVSKATFNNMKKDKDLKIMQDIDEHQEHKTDTVQSRLQPSK